MFNISNSLYILDQYALLCCESVSSGNISVQSDGLSQIYKFKIRKNSTRLKCDM